MVFWMDLYFACTIVAVLSTFLYMNSLYNYYFLPKWMTFCNYLPMWLLIWFLFCCLCMNPRSMVMVDWYFFISLTSYKNILMKIKPLILIPVLFMLISLYTIFVNLRFHYHLFVISKKLGKFSMFDSMKLMFNFDLLLNFLKNFQQLLQWTLNDIKVGIFFCEGVNMIKIMSDNLYNLQKEFFKYKKPTKLEDTVKCSSDEELSDLIESLNSLSNPTIQFNKLSSLPWKFKYYHGGFMTDTYFFMHFLAMYTFFKTTLISVLVCFIYFLFTVFFFKMQFLKQLSVWFVMGMMFFWLISGFNFFMKSYQFGKFTAQMQRFWKSTNTCFWLIEGFLLLLFFYYYLNSSQEPIFMYDYSSLNQEYLMSLYTMGFNMMILSMVIFMMYFTLMSLNSNSWEQLSLNLLFISIFIFFSFFMETYQFYYVISVFNESLWVLNEEENIWSIETDNPILSTKTQYFLVCLMAKYWHFLFMFLSWVFFLMKSFESKKMTYVFFGSNLQNIMLLFVLNLACYVQWLKWVYSSFLDLPYFWFFTNMDNKFLYKFFCEFKLLYSQLFTFNTQMTYIYSTTLKSLSLWSVDSLFLWKFI